MKRFLMIAFCLLLNSEAFSQLKIGLELTAYSSKFTQISPDTIVPWGYSGAKVTQSPSYGLAPALILRKDLGKDFSLETGLGFWSDKHKLSLNGNHRFIGTEYDSTLKISLSYLHVPVLLNFEFPMKGILSLVFTGGIRSKILVYQEDNYQDIIFEKLGLGAMNKYKRIVLAPSIGFAGKWQGNNGKSFELGLFASKDATPFLNGPTVWGFYNNLYPARNLQTGISLRYFL